MKRILKGLIVSALAMLVLTGCAVPAASRTQNAPSATVRDGERENTPEAIDAEFAARFTAQEKAAQKLVKEENGHKVVVHKFGETVIPDHPRRIVVIRLEDLMVALDEPMAAANFKPSYYLYDELSRRGIDNISINDESKTINYEQVQAEKPDLIIMRDSFDKSVYDKLSQIAPTAAFNIRKEEPALLALAAALGKEEKGKTRLKQFYDTAKTYRLGIHEAIGDSSVALLRIMNKEVRLYPYSKNDINRFMYDLLNLRPPQMVLDADYSTTNNAISLERLPDLDVDYLLVSTGYGASSNENSAIAAGKYEKLKEDALWNVIPAVRQHHVVEVDSAVWNAHGIISRERAMKEIYDAWGRP